MKLTTVFSALATYVALVTAAPPPKPLPFTPSGGLETNSTPPVFKPLSDFDFQSINLALNQEWIELDLFHHGLAQFSVEEFEAAGLNAADRFLIQHMADQEVGHATALSNILGARAAKPCTYRYPFQTVHEFVDFCQTLTRFGEAGVYGFLEHLNSRASAQILLQSISVEARQQMIFRQFEGLFPMPEWHTTGITQSMAWTLLAPHLVTCPAENPRIEWQNFPALNITNNPNGTIIQDTAFYLNGTTSNSGNDTTSMGSDTVPTGGQPMGGNTGGSADGSSAASGNDTTPATGNSTTPVTGTNATSVIGSFRKPAITQNATALSAPGREIFLTWELPGKKVGYNNSYTTNTTAGPAKFVAWISQLNVTYTPLLNISGQTGRTIQPGGFIFGNGTAPIVNSTMFLVVTDANVTVTPANLTMINPHIVAGPAIYQSG
ncbi:hypothetical protein D9619_004091 [Psilocybe cf. subviscida]|uniref:Rds1 protein n=1 Tax=Psilocybe cf. subviscida TaxID=2480587 RepID=A0A8H5BRT1_9AGAR|nr:hypothetical protein D9619_004091 [Psilocybe cf. subviscida]